VTGTTPELNLPTGTDSDDIEVYLATSLPSALNTLDALFSFTTGHDHSGAHLGKPVAAVASGAHLVSPVIDSGGLHVVSGLIFKNDGAPLQIGTQDGQSLQLLTNNLARLTIDLNGTTTIAQNLAVTGTSTFTGGLAGQLLKNAGAALQVGTQDGQSLQLLTNNLARVTIDLNGTVTLAQNLAVTGTSSLGATVLAGAASLVAASTDGYLYVAGFNGVPTGVPTSQAGYVAMAISYTSQRLYAYVNGGWHYRSLNDT
jgi:hypothetical protein